MRKTALAIVGVLFAALLAGCAETAPLEADFSANPTSGTIPLTVQFTDQSTGEIIGWVWDFGDGSTSTVQNPVHTYTTRAEYTISLEVTGPSGSDTESKTDYIQAKEGELPARNIGDQWVYKLVSDTTESTFTEVVTGEEVVEGRDCWTEDFLFEPPTDGMSTMKAWIVKEMLFPLKMQGSGVYEGHPYTAVTIYSYEFLEGFSWWPLEVGRKGKVRETQTTTITSGGEVVSTETKTVTVIIEVEKKEEIEVLAGRFDSFKIVEKGEDGTVYRVYWYSDKVGNDVKGIEYANGQASAWVPASSMELKSYSLQGGQ